MHASGLPLWLRICLQWGRPGFDPWVGKIPWGREQLPIPVFWLGEFHGQRSLRGHTVHRVAKNQTRLSDFHFHAFNNRTPKTHEVKTDRTEVKIGNLTVIVWYSSPLLLIMARTTLQKINTKIENLNNTRNQPDLKDSLESLTHQQQGTQSW